MAREKTADKKQRALAIEERMYEHYGPGECSLDYDDPFRLTIATVLSAQCTDAAVNKVTPKLFERYPRVIDLATARLEDVEAIIHSLGFYHAKAKNLIALAQKVDRDFGGVLPADIDALQTLPGVGRKTANVVMCEGFKQPEGIAVDTHVFRIAHRLRLAGPSCDTPAKTESALLKIYPRECWLYINHQWVHFGREYCRARNPLCGDCIVSDLCPSCTRC